MQGRIFRVDLSDEARDYQATATEPGLAMLDRNSANYAILKRWLGELVAEPEWIAGDSANFYVYTEERGRLERVECRPARKADLEGPLQGELEALRSQIKKAKPESSTEELLHKITRQTFSRLTADLSQTDHDSYFFKYREPGGPWKLIWCWGYQRKDAQPASAVICQNLECHQLFARRPHARPLCPGCQQVVRKRSQGGAVVSVRSLWICLLLLLAGAALLALLNPPRLIVTPQQWNVPVGGRVDFNVTEQKWYFFEQDVTPQSHPLSHDRRVVEFADAGPVAHARSIGRTSVTIRYRDRVADVDVQVLPPRPPNSIEIVPGDVQLAIGSTARLKVQGLYEDGVTADLTELVEWTAGDDAIVFVHQGNLEGLQAGSTTVSARFPTADEESAIEASAAVAVAKVDFTALEVLLDPESIGIGEYGDLQVNALDAAGEKYRMLGSSQLTLLLTPPEVAEVEDEYVVGRQAGSGELAASVGELSQSLAFTVGDSSSLPGGTFFVTPDELALQVHEYYKFDVTAASSEAVYAISSDETVVEVVGGTEVAGRAPGEAEVTFMQGDGSQVVKVTVTAGDIELIRIEPSDIKVRVGEAIQIRVVAVGTEGQELNLSAAELTWLRQPPAEYADLDRAALELFGLAVTSQPYPLEVQFGDDLQAKARVEVVDSPLGSAFVTDFMVHPPIPVGPTLISPGTYLGGDFIYDNDGLLVRAIPEGSPLLAAGIPTGSVITGVNGGLFAGLPADELRGYLREHPIVDGDTVLYRTPDGQLLETVLGLSGIGVQEVRLLGVRPLNLTPNDFNAEVQLELRREAEYRLVDEAGNELSQWQQLGPAASVSLNSKTVARNSADEYELFIERRIGDTVRRFQLPFKLEAEM